MVRIQSAIALTFVLATPSGATTANPAIDVLADGKRHKVAYNGESYKVRITGNKISVFHIPTLAGRKRGTIIGDWNREVARAATGCELHDEYVDPASLALDAILVCPAGSEPNQ